ncbi:MAG TPA: DUF1905 domain-containing protein [Acidimicrobiia bacterium]|nr:DUF1905 domain-containing protein [Acidimicrobiia bacterium]
MHFVFTGELWYWRGPSPFHFVTVPPDQSQDIKEISTFVTYGWGMIPVQVKIGNTKWKTALWPKDGNYVLPIKDRVRLAEGLELGDETTVELDVVQAER